MNSQQALKTARALRALLVVGLALSLIAAVGGGLVLAIGFSQGAEAQSMSRLGQYMVGMGLTNLLIYLCISFLLQRVGGDIDSR